MIGEFGAIHHNLSVAGVDAVIRNRATLVAEEAVISVDASVTAANDLALSRERHNRLGLSMCEQSDET